MQMFAVVLLLAFFQTGLVAGNGWQTFAPKDCGFSIQIPGQPTEQKKLIKTPHGEVDMLMFEVNVPPGEGKLIVGVSEFPPSAIAAGTEDKRLDNARDGAVASAKGKLKREKSLVLQTYPGRELYIEVEGKATVLMRMYAVKNRLYQIVVVGTADLVTSQAAAKFLDSFKLAK